MLVNFAIAAIISLVAGLFASAIVVTISREEMKNDREEEPLLPIVIGEVVDDAEK